MRVVLRADAGFRDGTGHVMRVLTLAEALRERGHETHLVTAEIDVPWLAQQVADAGIAVQHVAAGTLGAEVIDGIDPERVVVDSYSIPARDITALNARVPVLAIVDGDARGIGATLYLDQNLGAEGRPATADPDRMLRGSTYALIRQDVRELRRPDPWRLPARPRIVAFMGGTDPTGGSERIAHVLAGVGPAAGITMIVREDRIAAVRETLGPDADVRIPTTGLPALLAAADVVVSAAGGSAWEVCTLAIPSVLIAVVENQRASLAEAVSRGVALGIDAIEDPGAITDRLGGMVGRLLDDEPFRRTISDSAAAAFDGRGSDRVAEALEKAGVPS